MVMVGAPSPFAVARSAVPSTASALVASGAVARCDVAGSRGVAGGRPDDGVPHAVRTRAKTHQERM
jgi:hypothetical protein